jgi:hypothetical protein
MLIITGTRSETLEIPSEEGVVVHPTSYILECQDPVGNALEIETCKETYVEVSIFLDKLKEV